MVTMVTKVRESRIGRYIRRKLYKERRRQRLAQVEKRRIDDRVTGLPPVIALPWDWRPCHASKPIDIPPRKRLF